MIHKSAVLSKTVMLGENVSIGPYSVLDGEIEVGDNCKIGPGCHITGNTRIGHGTKIHAGAVIGDEPQDHGYKGEKSYTRIGSNCILREYVTIHRGADPDSSTVVGDNVMLMAFVHVAHNCQIGKNVNMVNTSMLAGHVHLGEGAFISTGTVVHQFVHVGQYSLTSAYARVNKDIPPYCLLAEGDRIYGPNIVGLRRAGFSREVRSAIKASVKLTFFQNLAPKEALSKIEESYGHLPEIKQFIDFIQNSKRGIMTGSPKRGKS